MSGYETYEEMIRETDELVRRVMIENRIVSVVVIVLLAGLAGFIGWLAWTEHRAKMAEIKAQDEWLAMHEPEPEDVQYQMGNVYYRMR